MVTAKGKKRVRPTSSKNEGRTVDEFLNSYNRLLARRRYCATFRVVGTIEDLDEITTRLGVEPTRTVKKGRAGSHEDAWLLAAKVPKKRTMRYHVKWLRKKLESKNRAIRRLAKTHRIELHCEYTDPSGLVGFDILPEDCLWFTKLGLPLKISVLVPGVGTQKPMRREHSASLRVMGKIVSLDAISRALRITPTDAHYRGEKRRPNSRPYVKDQWSIKASVSRDRELKHHIESLRKKLEPRRSALKRLAKEHETDLYCTYLGNNEHADFEIQPEPLRWFAALDVPFGFSIVVM